MIKLYHYVHCPYCVRVRLALGYFKIPFESIVLPYHDEETPMALTGKKMLPIIATNQNGSIKYSNESLDIIAALDKDNLLQTQEILNSPQLDEMNKILEQLSKPLFNLCMPHWAYSKEFTEISRNYFIQKKEIKRGPFNKLVQNSNQFLSELNPLLDQIKIQINPFFQGKQMTLKDIMIASHLWGLYLVPEFQFSLGLNQYLQRIKNICSFNYQEDLWK